MKMPEQIDPIMLAPCGMNCLVCYKHCNSKKACAGCLAGDSGKPEHCRICKIKTCLRSRSISYCYECDTFPCKLIKNMEKSYQMRYQVRLIDYSRQVKELGTEEFMRLQKERWTCPSCGGVVSLHEKVCSECKETIKDIECR